MPDSHDGPLPRVAGTLPAPVRVSKGQTYQWCSCGLSQQQPFCDNSHAGTAFTPVIFTARKDEIIFFCTCKHSQEGMVCDGRSHQPLQHRNT
ncbi:MAG: CDGSH iron-sulfur domain-containing protein [Gammaproteobacteria bacterium]